MVVRTWLQCPSRIRPIPRATHVIEALVVVPVPDQSATHAVSRGLRHGPNLFNFSCPHRNQSIASVNSIWDPHWPCRRIMLTLRLSICTFRPLVCNVSGQHPLLLTPPTLDRQPGHIPVVVIVKSFIAQDMACRVILDMSCQYSASYHTQQSYTTFSADCQYP
jgi:hypothetical protein